jgi:hypothetical protein
MEPQPPLDPRIEKGRKLAEFVWFKLARRIVLLAGQHYKWSEEQWQDAQNTFLRPNDYKVIVK